jgi:hypothetical protein
VRVTYMMRFKVGIATMIEKPGHVPIVNWFNTIILYYIALTDCGLRVLVEMQ